MGIMLLFFAVNNVHWEIFKKLVKGTIEKESALLLRFRFFFFLFISRAELLYGFGRLVHALEELKHLHREG